MLEIRASGTLSSNGKTLTGYAAVFNSEAILGEFSEVIRTGAFSKSLASGSNIRALYHHDGKALLGTTRGGTLELREDTHGLAFTLALPDTSHGKDHFIVSDIPVFDDWLIDGETTYKAKDIDEFEQKIRAFQQKQLPSLKEAAYQVALDRNLPVIGEQLRAVYEKAYQLAKQR